MGRKQRINGRKIEAGPNVFIKFYEAGTSARVGRTAELVNDREIWDELWGNGWSTYWKGGSSDPDHVLLTVSQN